MLGGTTAKRLANVFEGSNIRAVVGEVNLEPPHTAPMALRHTAGELHTTASEFAILVPLVKSSEETAGKKIEVRKVRDKKRQTRDFEPGLIVIYPGVCYVMPNNTPFCPFFSNITGRPQAGSAS